MKWVVLGDIGRSDFYHLGDEAMTEVALEMLSDRGATEVTLVASDPVTANRTYDVPAVGRVAFEWDTGRLGCEQLLSEFSDGLGVSQHSDKQYGPLLDALQSADFALIAGGGNMNSQYSHLLYERLAFGRAAQHFGVPLFVTSQTVGPVLRRRDEEMVAELLEIAVCFGAREKTTASLLRALTERPAKVVHTYDDAVILRARPEDHAFLEPLDTHDRLIIASFTEDQGTSGLSEDEYVARIGSLLDDLSSNHDAHAVLVPHAGSLGGGPAVRDQRLNQLIVDRARSKRITAAAMPTARECVALTNVALCSVSSRYHPVVFGPQAGIATVGISLSTYSSVRMRGALANVGQERFVVPSVLLELAGQACDEAILSTSERLQQGPSARRYQLKWWDAIVEASRRGRWDDFEDLDFPPSSSPLGEWSIAVEAATPAFELWGEQAQRLGWVAEERDIWRGRALQAEGRKIVRVIDGVAGLLPGRR